MTFDVEVQWNLSLRPPGITWELRTATLVPMPIQYIEMDLRNIWWGIGDNAYAARPRELRLCWKTRTTSTSNQHHQQPFDLRLRWEIHTTSTSNQHHQQPFNTRLCWEINTTRIRRCMRGNRPWEIHVGGRGWSVGGDWLGKSSSSILGRGRKVEANRDIEEMMGARTSDWWYGLTEGLLAG